MNTDLVMYMAIGWAVISGIYAFNAFMRGSRFLSMWFEVFSGGAGIFAIGMVVFWLPSKYPDVTLTVFWGAVIVVIGGGWWLDRSCKIR